MYNYLYTHNQTRVYMYILVYTRSFRVYQIYRKLENIAKSSPVYASDKEPSAYVFFSLYEM